MKHLLDISYCLAAVGVTLAATACTNDREPSPGNENRTIIHANIGSPVESRTAIDLTEYEGGHVGILWTPGDAIGVFGGDVRNARFDNQLSEPAGRTSFAGNCATPQYAYYPYSAANDGADATALRGTLPARQSYDSTTGSIEGDYKVGVPRAGAPDEFDFRHLFALLRINVNATGTAIEGESLRSVTLSLPASRTLAGDFTFDATTGSYNFTGNTTNSVAVDWVDNPVLASGASRQAYMTCASDFKTDDEITITVTTNRHTATFTRRVAFDFAPSGVYTFNLTLSLFADDLVVEELPVEETANCYMITSAGEHDFCATVIGNGEKGIIKGAGFHTEDPYISPKSAKLLWQDVEGFLDASSVRLVDGRVRYTANKNVGNAVIAVYDGPDATGNILWSWHIWGVGDELPQDFELDTRKYSTDLHSSVRMMDRDLGAFPVTEAECLPAAGGRDAAVEARVLNAMLYQWGRKDPFPNSGKWYDAEGTETDLLTAKYNLLNPSKEEATLLYAIQHPCNYIDLYKTASVSDWVSDHNWMLWGDDRFSGQTPEGWTGVKTIYDPSPVGYRVANYFAYTWFIPVERNEVQLKGVMSMTIPSDGSAQYPALADNIRCVIATFMDGTVTRYIPKGITENRIGMSVDNKKQHGYGMFMKRNDSDATGNFFSQPGYVQGGGTRGYYGISSYRWMSCGAVTNTIDCGAFYLGQFAWRNAQSDYTDRDHDYGLPQGSAGVVGTIKTQYSLQPRYACAVRCVRE